MGHFRFRRSAFPLGVVLTLMAGVSAAAGGRSSFVQTPVSPGAVPSAPGSSAAKPGTGAISGTVIDAISRKPVVGAVVTLARLDNLNGSRPRCLTDARGRFVFPNLPAATSYFLGASRFGYASTRYGWTGPDQSLALKDILQINLADDQWINTITIPLWRFGTLNGRVLDERGEPAVGVVVRAFAVYPIAGQEQLVAGPLTTTDDRGVYRLVDLKPDRYVVSVLSVQSTVLATTPEVPQTRALAELESGGIGGGVATSVVSTPGVDVDGRHRLVLTNFATPPPPSSGQSRAYPAVFYPAARTAADATVVDIGYGDSRTGVDFYLDPVPAVRLSGRLDGTSGPPPPFLLRLMSAGSERLGFGSEAATTLVEPDGSFTFLNVPAGDYTILAQTSVMDFTSGDLRIRMPNAPGFAGGGASVGSMAGVPHLEYLSRTGPPAPVWGRLSVSVADRDLDSVIVTLHPAVKIHGRVVFAEGTRAPSPDRRMLITAEPATGDPSLGNHTGVTAPGDATFAFTIDDLMAGPYLLGTWANFGIVSVMYRDANVTDTGCDASLGHDFDDVIVTLTDKKIDISGVVLDRRSPGAAVVIAFPVDRERWTNYGWSPRRFRTAAVSSNGVYQLEDLSEGEYFAIAVDAAQGSAWVDPKFLETAAPFATRLSVKWGDKKTLDLTLAKVMIK